MIYMYAHVGIMYLFEVILMSYSTALSPWPLELYMYYSFNIANLMHPQHPEYRTLQASFHKTVM